MATKPTAATRYLTAGDEILVGIRSTHSSGRKLRDGVAVAIGGRTGRGADA